VDENLPTALPTTQKVTKAKTTKYK
jgi:hypothetical protein